MSGSAAVAITGAGMVSSLGAGLDAHWQAVLGKTTGIQRLAGNGTPGGPGYAGTVERCELPPDTPESILKQQRFMSPSSRLGLVALDEAVKQCGLDLLQLPSERKALYVGTGDFTKVGYHDYYPALQEAVGENGLDIERLNRAALHKVNPFVLLEWLTNNVVAFASVLYQARGPNTTLASQSPCGMQALELAARSLRRGQADVALVLGTCSWVKPIPLFEMDTLGLLSRGRDGARSFRPFDRRRDGFLAGDGATALVLEPVDLARRRNATILGAFRGFGSFTELSTDGAFAPVAEAAVKAAAAALEEAGGRAGDLAFISPHGNGTRKGDRAELIAMERLLGADAASVPLCGLKAYTGHMGGASDVGEIALGLAALRHGLVPATLNFEKPEHGFERLALSGDHIPTTGTRFLSLSQGFGGQSVAVVVSVE